MSNIEKRKDTSLELIRKFPDYEISKDGVIYSNKSYHKSRDNSKPLKQNPDVDGYLMVTLYPGQKTKKVHLLVWDTYGECQRKGNDIVVDHIDENKTNNNINNLQLLTNGDNVYKSIDKTKTSSKYRGVSFRKDNSKWAARITINKKEKYLGQFNTEEEAHEYREVYKKQIKKHE